MSSSIFDAFDIAPQTRNLKPKIIAPSSSKVMTSSEISHASSANVAVSPVVINFGPLPDLWRELKNELLSAAVARRLLREVSRVCSLFHGDLPDPALHRFRRSFYPLVPHGAAEVLSHACDVDVLTGLQECLRELCSFSGEIHGDVVEKAFQLLENGGRMCDCFPAPNILCGVILHSIVQREELAEKLVAEESRKQIQICSSFGIANDEFRYHRSSKCFLSSHIMRRSVVQVS
jgi:hypothetical protein